MFGQYVAAVVRRAFQPTVRVTDALQILAASTAPAVARVTGLSVPTSDNILAYIGAVAVAFIILRLFFVAPYQLWREQWVEMEGLRSDLRQPQRLESAKLAEIRAACKAELAATIHEMLFMVARYNAERDRPRLAKLVTAARSLGGRGNVSEVFERAFVSFSTRCFDILEAPDPPRDESELPKQLLQDLQAYLHGEITAEALALRLPPEN